MKIINYILVAATVLGLSSCTSFLGVNPDKSGNATIYHMDQLNGLLSNYGIYNGSSATGFEGTLLSDDCDVAPNYLKTKASVGGEAYGTSVWDKATLELTMLEKLSWNGAYANLFVFNTILENADKVIQTTAQENAMVKGEALFGRAYFHFCALLMYCQHNETAPGIGYKTDTKPNSIPARETVKYTMDKIDADIVAAEAALKTAGRTQFEIKRNFRITLPTLYALKARVELYKGNYQTALAAANDALAGYSELYDFRKDPLYVLTTPKKIDLLDEQGNKTGATLPYYQMTQLMARGREAISQNTELYLPHATGEFIANRSLPISKGLYDMFDREHDERWIRFYNNNYLIANEIGKNGFSYADQKNIEPWQYHTYLRFVNSPGDSEKLYVMGLSTPEMFLIKAECLARGGENDQAKAILQKIRSIRFTTMEAANKIGGSVQDVLDERRRELTSVFRWYDIKRLNAKEGANIKISKKRYTILNDKTSPVIDVLVEPNSPRYAIPISPAQLQLMGWEQNAY